MWNPKTQREECFQCGSPEHDTADHGRAQEPSKYVTREEAQSNLDASYQRWKREWQERYDSLKAQHDKYEAALKTICENGRNPTAEAALGLTNNPS